MPFLEFVANLKAVDVLQIHIQCDQVELVFMRQFQCLFPCHYHFGFATGARDSLREIRVRELYIAFCIWVAVFIAKRRWKWE